MFYKRSNEVFIVKINQILKLFKEDLENFLEKYGEDTSDDDCFYVMIGDTYFQVNIKDSYWYHEDDGTVVFRVNDVL